MTDKPTDQGRRGFIAAGSLIGAAGALWSTFPFAAAAGSTPSTITGGNMTADIIFFNGDLHTVDREKPRAQAVAIKDGKFVAVGSDAEAMAFRSDAPPSDPWRTQLQP